jgi:putative tryptophan/tyrosine transport system substrate-binding protein
LLNPQEDNGLVRIIFTVIIFFVTLCHAGLLHAFNVLAVKGADIKPYQDALAGFRSTCDCSVSELPLGSGGQQSLAAQISSSNADAVLAIGIEAIRRVQTLKDVPIIYTMAPHTMLGVIPDNMSGISMLISAEKQLDTIIETFPQVKRIGIIHDPQKDMSFLKDAMHHATTHGIVLISEKAYKSGDVPGLIEGMKDRIDLFWMVPDTTVTTPETVNKLLLFSFQNRVPVFSFAPKYVEMGAVAAVSVDPFDLGAQAGEIARALLQQPKKQPVRSAPSKTVLTINRTVAKKIGVKISESSLARAKEVR